MRETAAAPTRDHVVAVVEMFPRCAQCGEPLTDGQPYRLTSAGMRWEHVACTESPPGGAHAAV